MKPRTLLRFYPPAWRARYGAEFIALLEKEGTRPGVLFNVIAGAFDAWMSPKTPTEMALDGPFGPAVLGEPTDTKEGLYSASHFLHILAAIGVGLLTYGAVWWVSPGWANHGFLAGFLAATQLWTFRFFSLRTRIAAVFWAFVLMMGLPLLVFGLFIVLYEWFGK